MIAERRSGAGAKLADAFKGVGRRLRERVEKDEQILDTTGHVIIPTGEYEPFDHMRVRRGVRNSTMSLAEATRGRGASDDQEVLPIHEVDGQLAEELSESTSIFGPKGLNWRD